MKMVSMIGRRFGALTVVSQAPNYRTEARWNCECACGGTAIVRGGALRNGNTKSCGCRRAEVGRQHLTVHGLSERPEYEIWKTMRQRCLNRKNKKYASYGGRGIKVCDRWSSFDLFYKDMGARPSARHSIERVDNDGNYEPSNCRWATASEQRKNQRPRSRWAEALTD